MKEVELTKGYVALVDDEDYGRVSSLRWQACPRSGRKSGTVYALGREVGTKRHLIMHRMILGWPPAHLVVDHIDGNGLNNQKSNLRLCSPRQNLYNGKMRASNKSGYRGVSWNKRSRKWEARIRDHAKKYLYLGGFQDKLDAAKARDEAAISLWGGFARLNFPTVAANPAPLPSAPDAAGQP